jgi:hypothetical protein
MKEGGGRREGRIEGEGQQVESAGEDARDQEAGRRAVHVQRTGHTRSVSAALSYIAAGLWHTFYAAQRDEFYHAVLHRKLLNFISLCCVDDIQCTSSVHSSVYRRGTRGGYTHTVSWEAAVRALLCHPLVSPQSLQRAS